jgi:hypothetical protein
VIELIQGFLSKFGMPGIIISIILFVLKMNPVTLISYSSIEMKLSTKDKRLYIRTIRTIFEIILYVLFILLITDQFFKDKQIYDSTITTILTIIISGIFFLIFLLDTRGKTYFDLVENYKVKWKVLFYILFLIYILSFFLLPSYYVGTQVYSKFYDDSLTKAEQYGALLAVITFYLILIAASYFTVIKTFYRFLGFSNREANITVNIDNDTWFIFHQTENELFLLGNNSKINNCTRFKFIEKNELLKEIIEVEKLNEA